MNRKKWTFKCNFCVLDTRYIQQRWIDTENVKSPAYIYVVWGHSTWLPLMLFLTLDRGDIKWNPVFIQPLDQIFARPSALRVVILPLEDIHCEQVIAHFSRSHRAPVTRALAWGCRRLRRKVLQSQRKPLLGRYSIRTPMQLLRETGKYKTLCYACVPISRLVGAFSMINCNCKT